MPRRRRATPLHRTRARNFRNYAACGLDLLVLMPEVRSLRQLELLAEHILPEHRH
jgi:hypothetical protein